MAYANEPTFKDRLDDLVEDFKQLLSDQEDVENYIKTIVDTRNSLVHQSSKKKIFKGLELLYASKYVESVVKINIFRVLGVPEEVIQKSIINAKGELSEMYRFNKRLQLSLPNTAYKK